jgi:hypothetical protein
MGPTRFRHIDWSNIALSLGTAGVLLVLGFAFFSGSATVTLAIVALLAAVSPLVTAVISVEVAGDSLLVRQGVSGNPERIRLDDIAVARTVEVSRRQRYLRAFAPEGVEVMSAGGSRGVELELRRPRRARFTRKAADRLIIGYPRPEELRDAIEAARRVDSGAA